MKLRLFETGTSDFSDGKKLFIAISTHHIGNFPQKNGQLILGKECSLYSEIESQVNALKDELDSILGDAKQFLSSYVTSHPPKSC